ncbi:MAG: hypothetical protein K2H33_03635 [Muribaculaceae bacterium]|nr:hypothetical protein [Muribaculaceae bacterium]MDE6118283.1 hypothetical protein [Muribaculaceae bacterium]MDE6315462.1 hypothetical protein [Muribaculaceae bacterium]
MKHFCYLIASAATVAAMASCESPSRLASRIEGEWSGTPERITDTSLSYLSMTPAYEFVRNDGADADRSAGKVTLTAQIDTTMPADGFPVDSLGEVPVSFSVAAVVTVNGTWKAIDDDEVLVRFSTSDMLTSVDSKAVCEYTSPMSAADKPQTVELPSPVLESIGRQITTSMTHYVANISKLDDIEIRDNFMKFEIGKKDFTFTRL